MDAVINNVIDGVVSTITNSSLWQSVTNGQIGDNYYYIIAGVVAIFLLYKLISIPFRFLLNGLLGCVMLLGVNWVGALVNFSVPVNVITALIAGIFGIPGIIGIVVYYIFFA